MKSRPGITLVEVLVAIFIMAIGLLALLTLFPLGALSMAAALRDQRNSEAAEQANACANAMSVRTDTAPNLQAAFTTNGNTLPATGLAPVTRCSSIRGGCASARRETSDQSSGPIPRTL